MAVQTEMPRVTLERCDEAVELAGFLPAMEELT